MVNMNCFSVNLFLSNCVARFIIAMGEFHLGPFAQQSTRRRLVALLNPVIFNINNEGHFSHIF